MQDVEGTAVRLRILPARGSPSGLLLLSHVGSSLASTGVCDRWSASKKLRQMRQRRDIRRVATGHPQAGQWAGEWLEQQGSAFRKIQQQEQGLEELVARARRELEEVGQQWWTPGHSGRHCTCWIQHQAGLQVLLHSPAVSLDNNIAERMLRGLVIVRLTTSARAATSGQAGWDEALAVMDAEPAGINPWTWTLEYLQACATSDRQPPADLRPVCLG